MKITTLPSALHADLLAAPKSGKTVLVPTMGALHEGHLELIRAAKSHAGTNGKVVVSIFVNPTQFDRAEDLDHYPRTLESDLEQCRDLGVDLAFTPESNSMYASDHSVTVTEKSLTQRLCGATRPGHFDGVCTVVLKLFNLTRADVAVFGKKDYQQLAVIRRMVRDLDVPIEIVAAETVREKSGLAMSSRNRRLTSEQFEDAPRIRRALLTAQSSCSNGEKDASTLLAEARKIIESGHAGARIDYLELLDADSLQPIEQITSPVVMATAVFYGDVRLIDNIEMV